VLRLALAAAVLFDISASGSRLNPGTARFAKPIAVASDGWTNWDLSYDGSVLGATQGDGKVVMIETLTGRVLASIDTDGHSVHDTAIAGDGRHYALTLDNGTVQVYSAAERKKVGEFKVSAGFC